MQIGEKLKNECFELLANIALSELYSKGFLLEYGFDFKTSPSDFAVAEDIKFEPDGGDEHEYLQVWKSGVDHLEMIKRLSKHFETPESTIGYAGRKDAMAETVQYVSLPSEAFHKAPTLDCEDIRILHHLPHSQKLRVGQVKRNHFRIKVHGDFSQYEHRIGEVIQHFQVKGFKNFFGEQRFSKSSVKNFPSFWRGLKGDSSLKRNDKWQVSVFQSALFNIYIDRMKDDFQSGPVFGWKSFAKDEAQLAAETSFLHSYELDYLDFKKLKKSGMGTRRRVWVFAEELSVERKEDGLIFQFYLGSGSYATVFLRFFLNHLVGLPVSSH